MLNEISKVLLTENQIREKTKELGARISEDYKGKNLFLVSILKGAAIFMSDLLRSITLHCKIDFMAVSSYGERIKTSGIVRILKDLDVSLEGYDVLIVEDILDSGMTLSYVSELLHTRNLSSMKICTLLDKPVCRRVDIKADYIGFEIPNEFVVGYGLDYAERYRNLPFIGVLKPEIYKE